jgi:hypothetical protein
MDSTPWFHETPGPNWVNEWTWTHVVWGMATARAIPDGLVALGAHTLYEMVEGKVFPDPHRDVSVENHLGDTLAFLAGRAVVRLLT